MKLNRKLSTKEVVLFLVLVFAFLALLYYEVVYIPLNEQIASYDTTEIESEMQLEQARAQKIKAMNEEMAANKAESVGVVATYDNIKNEMKALNEIVGKASTYNFSFQDPVGSGSTVRRNIDISFTANNYSDAETIIRELYSCEYRLLIQDMTISPVTYDDLETGDVSVNMTVTFFETTDGASTTEGIVWQDNGDGTTGDGSDTSSDSAASSSVSTG